MVIPQTEITVHTQGKPGRRVTVPPGEYIIGRQEDCDIVADDENVSRKHAQLVINYDSALIEDLGSSQGTFVNDKPAVGLVRLWPNQRIRLGPTTSIELHRQKAATQPGVSIPPVQATVQRLLPDEFLREKKYDIGEMVARGGMGVILCAKEATTERTVAMKVMLDTMTPADLVRFIDEARITAQLEHPNIVPVYDLAVDENEKVFYTMKFVRGVTLRAVLEQLQAGEPIATKKYDRTALLTIFQKICDAIAFDHSKGVIHRDLKPENIMLGDFGEVLVMDWGLMKVLGQSENRELAQQSIMMRTMVKKVNDPVTISTTMAGSVFGTPQYMSPEQASGEVDTLDEGADIYSLGAILYHMVCLRPSVDGDDAEEIIKRVREGKIDRIGNARERVPESVVAVIRKAMALDRRQRYASVKALQKDIAAYQAGFATSAEEAGLRKQLLLLVRRNKAVFATGAAAFLALVGLTTWFIFNLQGERNAAEEARASAEKERNIAQTALANLLQTAPTFYETARVAYNEAKYDEALEKIGYAVTLDPKNADYHLLRGNLLEIAQRLTEARADYAKALELRPDDPAAQTNLALCDQLLQESGGQPLSTDLLKKLDVALRKQGRVVDAAPIETQLGKQSVTEKSAMKDTILAHIQEFLKTRTKPPAWDTVTADTSSGEEGVFMVHLEDCKIDNLAVLQGLPISCLHLERTNITDLTPLRGIPTLRSLYLNGDAVRDLSPLRGLSLHYLTADSTQVADLTPLQGMPLVSLSLLQAPVSDLSPLRGMPLTALTLGGTQVNDLSPLRAMPLQRIDLPGTVSDFSPLPLGSLASIKIHDSSIVSLNFLANWQGTTLDLARCNNVTDISALSTCPHLQFLSLDSTGIHDLSPLSKLPLRTLKCGNSPVASIEPLRGLPLQTLDLYDTPVLDLSPLLDCPTLENLILPNDKIDLTMLHSLPNLKTLAIHGKGELNDYKATQTATAFWATHGGLAAPGAK